MSERWRKIAGWPGYEVSDLGRVRSIDRIICDGRFIRGRVLRTTGTKYPIATLSNGKTQCFNVHRLVLEAFRGPCPKGLEACHNNGKRRDCRLTNLRWDTRSANAHDTTKHGQRKSRRGENSWSAKLTWADIPVIHKMRKQGYTVRAIADHYEMSASAIDNIVYGVSWKSK